MKLDGMKLLLLLLALTIAVPSVQADGCAMGGAADSTEQAAGGHDCCPGEAEQTPAQEPPCDENGHCAGCFISVALVTLQLQSVAQQRPLGVFETPLPALVPSHSAPPYRPPIS